VDGRASIPDDSTVNSTATENALRAHFRAHNASVLAGSGIAVVFSAFGWLIFYGVSYWATMFLLTVAHSGEGQVSERFNDIFLVTAGVLMVTARVQQWISPHERAVDRRPPLGHVLDVLLFVPRFTLSAWQNLSALVSLRSGDLREAAGFLDRLRREGRIPAQQLATQFPDERTSNRILYALKVARVVDQLTSGDLTWLYISSIAPEAFRGLARKAVEPADKFNGIRRANVVESPDSRQKRLNEPHREDGSAG
jgi:hypothetical protein